jgi:hypothetical protein
VFNFFNLINKLELVSGDCEVGTLKLNYFVWTKVDISVLKFLMLQQLLQFLRDLFYFPLQNFQQVLSQGLHSINWMIYKLLIGDNMKRNYHFMT